MAPGHWRKILDQCFVIRREAYLAAGGFDPSLGHFAEWMLAARCHRMGLVLGYVPDACVHHLYIGDLEVWREFTRDFVRGEIAALARGDADGLIDLFGVAAEWAARERWDPTTARRMLRLCLRAGADARAALRWLPAALGGQHLRRQRAWVNARLGWWRARRDERAAPLAALRASVLRSMGALAHEERLRAIDRWSAVPPARRAAGAWEAGRCASLRTAGVRQPLPGDEPVAWTEPAGMIELPMVPGRYDIVVEWRRLPRDPAPRFFLNERPLASVELRPEEGSARMAVSVTEADQARLAWVCRRPGLPLTRIAWAPAVSEPAGARGTGAASRAAT
jgi:hypothetical protein